MKLDPTLVGDRPLSAVSVAAHATARGASASMSVTTSIITGRFAASACAISPPISPGFSTRMPSAPDKKKAACLTRDASNRLGVCWDWLDGDGNGVTRKPGAAPAAGRPLHYGISIRPLSASGHSRLERPRPMSASPRKRTNSRSSR
jgi:hypothetical protein